MTPRGLLVEGAGAAGLMEALRRRPEFPALLAGGPALGPGETLAGLPDPGACEPPDLERDLARCAPLRRIVQRLAALRERSPSAGFVLEHFHLSWYAVLPNWRLYAAMDEGLLRLGARLVVVGSAAGFDDALAKTRLPALVLGDPSAGADALAARVAEFWVP